MREEGHGHETIKVVDLVSYAFTAGSTLLGVLLGGWLSVRNQDRLWRRDYARQWRDIRLSAYTDFLSAYREYFAFALEPDAKIKNVVRVELGGEPLPYFDEHGRPYKERLDAALMTVRMVAGSPEILGVANRLAKHVRAIAAARATYTADNIPQETFDTLWKSQQDFLVAVRQDLGLSPDTGFAEV